MGHAFALAAAAFSAWSVACTQTQKTEESGMAATPMEYINPEGMHRSPVFSQGIAVPAGMRTLIIGGQNGVDEAGNVVSNELAGQTARAIENLITVLEAAGGTLDDLVRVGLYLKGDGDITPGFEEWMKHAGKLENPPAVTMVRVLGLASPDFLIEIEATAVLKQPGRHEQAARPDAR